MKKCRMCGAPMTKTEVGYKCSGCTNVEPLGTNKNVVPIVLIAFVCIAVLSFVVLFFSMLWMNLSGGQEAQTDKKWEQQSGSNNVKDKDVTAEVDGFRSGTMSQIVYRIFGKNAEEVTAEELASIQYIEMLGSWSKDGVTFRYSTEDYRDYLPDTMDRVPEYNDEIPFSYTSEFLDTLQTIHVQLVDNDTDLVYGDLQNFSGVNALNLKSYSYIDLSKFPNLSMIICNNTDISVLIKANVPAKQIESLHADSIDLTGIEQFTGLKRLYLKYNDFAQLEKVTTCENLEELYCVRLKGDKSYEILSKMPDLKLLYLEGSSEGVKDLSVLAKMTSLESLSIVDTEIIQVDFLKELQNLKILRLARNGYLEDMEALGELQNLEYLELNINASNGIQHKYESISKLKNLKKLALDTVYELDFLYELNQLEELEIDLTFYNYLLEPIRQMKNLEKLSLISCHSQYNDGFACLKELPNLKYLRVEGMEFDDPVDGLFSLENLEELHITKCDLYVPPLAVNVGENLRVLNFSSTDFRVMPGYGEYMYVGYDDPAIFQYVLDHYLQVKSLEELYLDWCVFEHLAGMGNLSNLEILSLNYCELTELPETDLAGCESLRELYLQGNKISDISFVLNLPALERINLWDCYVTDLSPLWKCKKLEYVNAKNNPISNNPLTGVEVIVD